MYLLGKRLLFPQPRQGCLWEAAQGECVHSHGAWRKGSGEGGPEADSEALQHCCGFRSFFSVAFLVAWQWGLSLGLHPGQNPKNTPRRGGKSSGPQQSGAAGGAGGGLGP